VAYQPDQEAVNPIKMGGLNTEQMTAAIVLGALVALIMINRGFRGVSVGRVTGGLVRP